MQSTWTPRQLASGLAIWILLATWTIAADAQPSDWRIDHRYSPPWWQTLICLVDDAEKTLVGSDGSLLYDYPGPYFHPIRLNGFDYSGYKTRIAPEMIESAEQTDQRLHSPRVPIVQTFRHCGSVEVVEEAFSLPPASLDGSSKPQLGGLHYDVLLRRLCNKGKEAVTVTPSLLIESQEPLEIVNQRTAVRVGPQTWIIGPKQFEVVEQTKERLVIHNGPVKLAPGEKVTLTTVVARGKQAPVWHKEWSDPESLRRRAVEYWNKAGLPFDRIVVPDKGIQSLLDASIRHLYQLRDSSQGFPMTLGGPSCYRSLWIVDAAFASDALAYLGETDTARQTIEELLKKQNKDGGFMLIGGHWKETGIMLWVITQHARLTGDRKWLTKQWAKIELAFEYVRRTRKATESDPKALNYRLLPDGFSDGGLAGQYPEYSNIYWTLAGLRAACDAATWMDKSAQADAWRKEYEDFLATFRRAAQRDMKTDPRGFRYLSVRMRDDENVAPQKAQWAFLHAVFPGKVFAADDPLVAGNLAMLNANRRQGMVYGTGWMNDGIWTYFGSFMAHAYLWNGDGRRAARLLYAFGNHASPLFCWREEQQLKGKGDLVLGDMPHGWANSEIIRLVRHLLVLERNDELHLCEGLPRAWLQPGQTVHLHEMPTEYGPLSLSIETSADGQSVKLTLGSTAS